jgi:hypothetical protein
LKSLVDGISGVVVLCHEGFVLLVLLLPEEGGLVEGLPVLALVGLELGDSGLELLPSGLEEVLENVVGSLDVDDGVGDVLFEAGDEGVVLVGSDVEVKVQVIQLVVEVSDQVLDSGDELIDDVAGHDVEFDHVEHGLAPFGFGELVNLLLGGSGGSFDLQGESACNQDG